MKAICSICLKYLDFSICPKKKTYTAICCGFKYKLTFIKNKIPILPVEEIK